MDTAQLHMAPIISTRGHQTKVEHFTPEDCVCTKEINFAVDNGSIDYVSFEGGCEGNLKAIAAMIEGMNVDFVLDRFSGITCGSKSTSCVDQFCRALRESLPDQQSK